MNEGRLPDAGAPFPAPPGPPPVRLQHRVRSAALRWMGRLYGEPLRSGQQPRSVLLIRPDHLGDMLFATPAFRLLREALPQARLALLAGPWSQAIVAHNSDLDEVLTCPFPGFERRAKTSLVAPYRLLSATARELRGRFDAAVVLRFDHWWGAWLAAAAGIPRRIGYDGEEMRPFLTEMLPYRPEMHEVQQNATLVAALVSSFSGRAGPLRFHVGDEGRAWAAGWLANQGVSAGRPLIAIHPGAGAAVKQWPAAWWVEVGNRLAADLGARILLTGGAAERPLTSRVASSLSAPTLDAAGQTDLEQLAALLERCTLVLGSDSGPLHLAVAVGAPTVHLYGPISTAKFGPWGDPARHAALKTGWPCAPCNRLDWPDDILPQHACMSAITPEEVINAAAQVLRGA